MTARSAPTAPSGWARMDDRPQKGADRRALPRRPLRRGFAQGGGDLRLQRARLDRRRRGHVLRRFARAVDRSLALRPLERGRCRSGRASPIPTRRPAGRTAAAATRRVSTGAPASPPGASTASRRTARWQRPMTCRCRRRPCRASAGPDFATLFLTSLREGRSAELLERAPLAGALLAAPSARGRLRRLALPGRLTMADAAFLARCIAAGAGREPADLVIGDVELLDVMTGALTQHRRRHRRRPHRRHACPLRGAAAHRRQRPHLRARLHRHASARRILAGDAARIRPLRAPARRHHGDLRPARDRQRAGARRHPLFPRRGRAHGDGPPRQPLLLRARRPPSRRRGRRFRPPIS